MSKSDRYAEAGVDIQAGNRLVDRIKPIVKQTHTPGVKTDIGGFGALFSMNASRYDHPILVSSTDGVGTKLKVAFMANRHETVGIDLVAMCVNDIIVLGAKPLFFLDYLACGKLDEDIAEQIISGIAEGCTQAKAALIGGETAEMPGMYTDGEYDLAGFAVGVVEDEEIIDGSSTRVGDKLIGIASSGLHSNGYSLVRKVFLEEMGLSLDDTPEGLDRPLVDELLEPTRIYAELVTNLTRDLTVRGIAHITGGGLTENIPRVIPDRCRVEIQEGSWPVPPIFNLLQNHGQISQEEMYKAFNNGLGLVVVVPTEQVEDAMDRLSAMEDEAWIIGEVLDAAEDKPRVSYI